MLRFIYVGEKCQNWPKVMVDRLYWSVLPDVAGLFLRLRSDIPSAYGMWSSDQLLAFGRSFVSAGRLVSALRFISVWVILPLGWLLLCLVVSPGEVCAVLNPRSLLFFFLRRLFVLSVF